MMVIEHTTGFLFAASAAPAGLAAQLSQHIPRSDEMVVEHLARNGQ